MSNNRGSGERFSCRILLATVLVNLLAFAVIAVTYGAPLRARVHHDSRDEDEKAPKIQRISKFRLDFKSENRAVPTGAWESVSGGDLYIEVVTKTLGGDHPKKHYKQKRPGQIYFSNITVKGPFVKDRKAVMDWVNSTAQGGRREGVDMTLSFVNDQGDDMATYTLFQCIPISYQPPGVSAGNYDMLEESLTFHVQEVRKANGGNDENGGGNAVRPQDHSSSSVIITRNPSDDALFGGKFRVDIGGEDIPVTSFSGGGVTFDKREVTGSERQGTIREYTITKVNWANIVIEKNAVQGDTKWKEWFERQSEGQVDYKNVTLDYQDSEGNPVRSIDFQNCWPVRYDVVNVGSRSGSSSIKEVIELVIEKATYR